MMFHAFSEAATIAVSAAVTFGVELNPFGASALALLEAWRSPLHLRHVLHLTFVRRSHGSWHPEKHCKRDLEAMPRFRRTSEKLQRTERDDTVQLNNLIH